MATHVHHKPARRMGRRRMERKPCPVAGCWEQTPGGGLCNACRSWDRRVRLMNRAELVVYAQRLGRFEGRSHELPQHAPKARHLRRVA
jgi:hypothetical protein